MTNIQTVFVFWRENCRIDDPSRHENILPDFDDWMWVGAFGWIHPQQTYTHTVSLSHFPSLFLSFVSLCLSLFYFLPLSLPPLLVISQQKSYEWTGNRKERSGYNTGNREVGSWIMVRLSSIWLCVQYRFLLVNAHSFAHMQLQDTIVSFQVFSTLSECTYACSLGLAYFRCALHFDPCSHPPIPSVRSSSTLGLQHNPTTALFFLLCHPHYCHWYIYTPFAHHKYAHALISVFSLSSSVIASSHFLTFSFTHS